MFWVKNKGIIFGYEIRAYENIVHLDILKVSEPKVRLSVEIFYAQTHFAF